MRTLTDIDASGNRVINLGEPVSGSDAATKSYVDSVASSGSPSGSVIPAFDLITSRYTRKVYNVGDMIIHDSTPCLRFLAHTFPPENSGNLLWLIYRYQNRGGSKYKYVLYDSVRNLSGPEEWINNGSGFCSRILPVSMMRIFWELFDPVADGSVIRFHEKPYDDYEQAMAWSRACRNNGRIAKYGNKDAYRRKESKALFSGSFALRIEDTVTRQSGPMVKFIIALVEETSGKLRFTMKTHSGIKLTSYR